MTPESKTHNDVFATPVEISEGVTKPLGECTAEDLDRAAALARSKGDEMFRKAEAAAASIGGRK